ncbi:hypothetical protein AGMMS50229_02770 [Campylobacterota bacterium]|nr:hypothetical protein AGMMS50229_02770 [Campylobacterota bacterium]
MDTLEIIEYATSKPNAMREYKPAWQAEVIKVGDKMFAFMSRNKEGEKIVNLKNDPETNASLREQYPEFVEAGYYSNKEHWNSWYYDQPNFDNELLKEQIDRSYELVAKNITKKRK